MPFLSISVLQLSRTDDHWELILYILEICCSLQVYVEVEPSDSQLVKKSRESFVLSEGPTLSKKRVDCPPSILNFGH